MRVWKKPPSGAEEVYVCGAQGEKLGRFGYGSGQFTTLRPERRTSELAC
jgi:hypothetical protein